VPKKPVPAGNAALLWQRSKTTIVLDGCVIALIAIYTVRALPWIITGVPAVPNV